MQKRMFVALGILALLICAAPAQATVVNVDLSSAVTGTFIDGLGADFAGTFAGQTIVGGTGISGSPTGPLTLLSSNSLVVAFFNPGVSPASNSILPTPGNQGPLSVLLESEADSVTWTMGSASPPSSVTIAFFTASGSLVSSMVQPLLFGYNVYSFSGLGSFHGFTIYDDNDGSGLRYQNFSYNSVAPAVPEPGVTVLLALGLAGLVMRRKGLI